MNLQCNTHNEYITTRRGRALCFMWRASDYPVHY
jgi:hypothetical protein